MELFGISLLNILIIIGAIIVGLFVLRLLWNIFTGFLRIVVAVVILGLIFALIITLLL